MKQRTSFRCLFYGLSMCIVTLMTVAMLDDNHLNNYCTEQKDLTLSKCIDSYHADFFYFVLIGDAFGAFAVFILDVLFFMLDQESEREYIRPTFCNNCGKSFQSGELWCGNKSCIEIWREKEISTKC